MSCRRVRMVWQWAVAGNGLVPAQGAVACDLAAQGRRVGEAAIGSITSRCRRAVDRRFRRLLEGKESTSQGGVVVTGMVRRAGAVHEVYLSDVNRPFFT